MKNKETDFYITYYFDYKEQKREYFPYDVSFDDYMAGVVAYFDMSDVKLDGTDTHVFNVLSVLGALSVIEEDEYFIDFITERCKDKALELFIEQKEEEEEFEKL